ncbi:MAG: LptF/LptG family permease [Gammaproteobacteria bacterium]
MPATFKRRAVILFRYFFRRVGGMIALVWAALSALAGFFEFLRYAGDYDAATALLLALLATPRLAMETSFFAAAIGAAAALRRADDSHELSVMRASGLSVSMVAAFSAAAALPVAGLYGAASELLIAPGRNVARLVREEGNIGRNVWLREGDNFARIGEVIGGNLLRDIIIYQTGGGQITTILTAKSGERISEGWLLRDVETAHPANGEVVREKFASRPWLMRINAGALSALNERPRDMSAAGLARASDALEHSGQNAAKFAGALWARAAGLPALLLLAASAVWMVHRRRRLTAPPAALGAAAIGGAYYFGKQMSAQAAVLFSSPALNLLPLLALAAAVFFALRHHRRL